MAGGETRNIFRAVALRHDADQMVYDHIVEITALGNRTGEPLSDRDIRHEVEAWLTEHDVLAAVSPDHVVWFAREEDATLFYLRFA